MPLVTVPAPSFYEASAPPAPLPLLTAETDSYALSTAGQSIYYEEVDPDRVKRTARVSFAVPTTPPCSKARQLPSLTIPQARSATPSDVDADRNSTSGSDTSDDSDSSNSSASDIDEDLKITKPPGEAGRPGRGGYSLEQVLSWPPTRMKQFQKTIAKLVSEHLDPTHSFSTQSLAHIRTVREEALRRFPELGDYQSEWPVADALKLRLKYTSARARKAAQQAVTNDTPSRERRSKRSWKQT